MGDKVSLPCDERGEIIKILDIPWGFKYVVKIEIATLNNVGDIHDFKETQISKINNQ